MCLSDSWLGWKLRNCAVCLSKSAAQTCLSRAWGSGLSGLLWFFVCRGLGILTCRSSLNMQCSGALDPTQVNHSRTFIWPLLYARHYVQRQGDGSEWKECIQSLSSKRILFTHMYLLCAEPEDMEHITV